MPIDQALLHIVQTYAELGGPFALHRKNLVIPDMENLSITGINFTEEEMCLFIGIPIKINSFPTYNPVRESTELLIFNLRPDQEKPQLAPNIKALFINTSANTKDLETLIDKAVMIYENIDGLLSIINRFNFLLEKPTTKRSFYSATDYITALEQINLWIVSAMHIQEETKYLEEMITLMQQCYDELDSRLKALGTERLTSTASDTYQGAAAAARSFVPTSILQANATRATLAARRALAVTSISGVDLKLEHRVKALDRLGEILEIASDKSISLGDPGESPFTISLHGIPTAAILRYVERDDLPIIEFTELTEANLYEPTFLIFSQETSFFSRTPNYTALRNAKAGLYTLDINSLAGKTMQNALTVAQTVHANIEVLNRVICFYQEISLDTYSHDLHQTIIASVNSLHQIGRACTLDEIARHVETIRTHLGAVTGTATRSAQDAFYHETNIRYQTLAGIDLSRFPDELKNLVTQYLAAIKAEVEQLRQSTENVNRKFTDFSNILSILKAQLTILYEPDVKTLDPEIISDYINNLRKIINIAETIKNILSPADRKSLSDISSKAQGRLNTLRQMHDTIQQQKQHEEAKRQQQVIAWAQQLDAPIAQTMTLLSRLITHLNQADFEGIKAISAEVENLLSTTSPEIAKNESAIAAQFSSGLKPLFGEAKNKFFTNIRGLKNIITIIELVDKIKSSHTQIDSLFEAGKITIQYSSNPQQTLASIQLAVPEKLADITERNSLYLAEIIRKTADATSIFSDIAVGFLLENQTRIAYETIASFKSASALLAEKLQAEVSHVMQIRLATAQQAREAQERKIQAETEIKSSIDTLKAACEEIITQVKSFAETIETDKSQLMIEAINTAIAQLGLQYKLTMEKFKHYSSLLTSVTPLSGELENIARIIVNINSGFKKLKIINDYLHTIVVPLNQKYQVDVNAISIDQARLDLSLISNQEIAAILNTFPELNIFTIEKLQSLNLLRNETLNSIEKAIQVKQETAKIAQEAAEQAYLLGLLEHLVATAQSELEVVQGKSQHVKTQIIAMATMMPKGNRELIEGAQQAMEALLCLLTRLKKIITGFDVQVNAIPNKPAFETLKIRYQEISSNVSETDIFIQDLKTCLEFLLLIGEIKKTLKASFESCQTTVTVESLNSISQVLASIPSISEITGRLRQSQIITEEKKTELNEMISSGIEKIKTAITAKQNELTAAQEESLRVAATRAKAEEAARDAVSAGVLTTASGATFRLLPSEDIQAKLSSLEEYHEQLFEL
jgi:hypothetical protein